MSHWEQWFAVGVIVFAILFAGASLETGLSKIREALGHIMDKMDGR